MGLPDLFGHRGQLIVFHTMWRWDLDAGCPSCSFQVDNVGHLAHLHAAGTTLAVVTRGRGGEVPHHDRYGDDHPETNIGFLLAGGGAATTA